MRAGEDSLQAGGRQAKQIGRVHPSLKGAVKSETKHLNGIHSGIKRTLRVTSNQKDRNPSAPA